MKTKSARRFKPNAKTTTTKCINCPQFKTGHRNHMKFCGHLCCVQDGLRRKEKGYIHKVFEGDQEELVKFLAKIPVHYALLNFYDIIKEIKSESKKTDSIFSWKYESKYFRLNYFPNIKKKCFEIYLVEEKYKMFQYFLNGEKRKENGFKNCDLEKQSEC